MFTPEMAKARALQRALASNKVQYALKEIETQYMEKGATLFTHEYTAILTTWVSKEEQDVIKDTMKEWGWFNVNINESYQSGKLVVTARGC